MGQAVADNLSFLTNMASHYEENVYMILVLLFQQPACCNKGSCNIPTVQAKHFKEIWKNSA